MQKKQSRDPITVISLITAACLIGDSMLYVALPTHWQEAGLASLWEVGAILSVNRLARLPLNPLVGWLYGKISARTGILFSVLLAVLTTAAYAFAQGFFAWLLIRCLWGLAWTFLRLGAYFTILDVSTDANRGRCMGRYNGLYRLGSLAGMLAGGLLADVWGLQRTALLFGALTLCAVPFVFRSFDVSPQPLTKKEPQQSAIGKPGAPVWKNRGILWALTSGMFVAMIYQGMFTATLSYLVEVHNGATVSWGGIMIGAATLSGFLQALRWGWEPWLAPWLGKKTDGKSGRYPILLLSLLIGGLLFALLPLDMPPLLWFAALLGIQLTATSLTTITDTIASDVAVATSKIAVMTLYSLLIDIGAAAGPFLAYAMNQWIGPYAACQGATLLLLCLAAQAYAKQRALRRSA